MAVDLSIPGDPDGIRALADHLDRMNSALGEVGLELAYIASDAQMYMTGQAGSAFQRTTTLVREQSNPVPNYLGEAADVFHAYANRLERGVRDFDSYLKQSREQGLQVYGTSVFRPTSLAEACSEPGIDPAWDEYMSKLRTYDDLCERVGTWWGELEAWVAEQFPPLMAKVEEFAPLDATFIDLSVGNKDLVTGVLAGAEDRSRRDLADWRNRADDLQTKADLVTRKLRSRNPAVKAAAEAANPTAMREQASDLLDNVRKVTKVSKLIPVAGNVIEVVTAAGDIMNGEPGSSVAAGVVGGVVGGAGFGAAIGGVVAGVLTPVGAVVAVAVGVAAGGIAVGAGARWGWEALVPLDVRESIDGWMYDATSGWQGPQLAR